MSIDESAARPPLRSFFSPASVAVVGVSTAPGNLGATTIANLTAWGFPGPIYPVGRSGGRVGGLELFPEPSDLPAGSVELACVLTPASTIPGVLETLGGLGVRSVCIQSGGFSERDEGGQDLARRTLDIARAHRMRLIGPNGLGTLSTQGRLCLPFIQLRPLHQGAIGVACQSGGVLLWYLRELEESHLGVSDAASLGNKLDLDEVDLIDHFAADPGTRVIFLYLEDIRRGRALMEAAARCGKPVVLQKANRTRAARAAAASHTASLLDDHDVVRAAARQAGIILVESSSGALDAIKALSLPPVRGRRLVVASRSGGHAVVGADACADHGFELPHLPESVERTLRANVRAGIIRFGNPVDMGDLWNFDAYAPVVESMARLDDIDGVVFVFEALPLDPAITLRLGQRLRALSEELGKPIVYCLMSWRENLEKVASELHGWPLFSSVEKAVEALALSRDWHQRWTPAAGGVAQPPPATLPGPTALPLADALRLVEEAGLPLAPTRLVRDAASAAAAAAELGFPVAVKILSPQHSHKSDVGGVALGLTDAAAVEQACARMQERLRAGDPGAALEGFCVQAMAAAGLELIVGFRRDPHFGPVILTGLGGTFVEVLRDVALRLAPASTAEALEMLRELSAYPLLCGARGGPALDRQALAELISRFSQLAASAPAHVGELELNPVILYPRGCCIVDVRAFAASPAE
jgi:acetate---CoA ligase (ADP-forming)